MLIGANLEQPAPTSVDLVTVGSTLDLADAVAAHAGQADLVVMAAAVADYRPATVSDGKLRKADHEENLTIELVQNPDILAGLVRDRLGEQVIVGFAAETAPDRDSLIELGRQKLARKGCDYLVLNRVGWSEGFATEGNTIVVLDSAGAIVMEASGSKSSVADSLLDSLV